MANEKLFMVMLGCRPPGRNTEQHDIFFGIGKDLTALIPHFDAFWPDAESKIHIDAWREVSHVDGYLVSIVPKQIAYSQLITREQKLFFINLGGYKPGEFEEYHYKLLSVADQKGAAVQASKQTAFYKHTGFKGAMSHIDDKYGIDVDDIYEIDELLPSYIKEKFSIVLVPGSIANEDELNIGYLKLSSLKD